MIVRPKQYNVVLNENENVYASYTHIGGQWMGGLFARRHLSAGDIIARYTGIEYSPPSLADDVKDQSYMFTARMTTDGRKRVVIDGNPAVAPNNLAGYANYAEGRSANAFFVDLAQHAPDGVNTFVVIQVAEHIASGTEIRIDYDMGSNSHPFRDQMIASGIPRDALRGREYIRKKWVYPNVAYAHSSHTVSDADLPILQNVHPVIPFAAQTTSAWKRPRTSPPKNTSGRKRPRGRPPKNTVWDPERGYVPLR